uniref:Uncharacterized protein n=1 Tax=Anopheles culicifacies TaxID=139723 RepID=A0A182ME72_9DIPT
MKLSVSAYRAHASAHKKILSSSSYQTQFNYGSTAAASSSAPTSSALFSVSATARRKLREPFLFFFSLSQQQAEPKRRRQRDTMHLQMTIGTFATYNLSCVVYSFVFSFSLLF